jgi:pyruvate dehydrogenase E2 component (dihydrolipoamide acetyltransferase)
MAETVIMPKLGFDMQEGTLVRWVIEEGAPVSKGQILVEVETDKATVEVESTFTGIVARHLVEQGTVVPVNTPIAIIAAPGEKVDNTSPVHPVTPSPHHPVTPPPSHPDTPLPSHPATPSPLPSTSTHLKASPLARKIAQEKGIDLSAVKGTGPGGRIVKQDVETIRDQRSAISPQPKPFPGAPISLNRLRLAIGRRMVEAKQQIPHFYVTHEVDMAALMALRKQVNALLNEEEKLSVNDFIVKAAALALRQFPNLNASLQGESLLQHGQVNVGVAVSVEGGLLTVVCRNADLKPLRQVAAEIKALVARARQGKVHPEDIEGSTFSISNLGMFDVEHFIAIINPPEAAVLAVGSVRQVPVVAGGNENSPAQIVPGMRMKVTLSVDHRISDGAEAAQFLQALAKYLQEPMRLLLPDISAEA